MVALTFLLCLIIVSSGSCRSIRDAIAKGLGLRPGSHRPSLPKASLEASNAYSVHRSQSQSRYIDSISEEQTGSHRRKRHRVLAATSEHQLTLVDKAVLLKLFSHMKF
ncbi:hypothetical protein M514_01592 [Trichuris suis]|uniref:Uncharacterized protein n=1 Tax=Trichuris suis TaxID=68888 RepID=A0A085MJU3_9BILA|nr:hypothetical protein M513_01592 [Trichuris suis]KFD66594.1 hypothetical protein M514_01592 [Trichuris suis]